MKVLILSMFLISCVPEKINNPVFGMECFKISEGISLYRCENVEAVCYTRAAGESGVTCKFKEKIDD